MRKRGWKFGSRRQGENHYFRLNRRPEMKTTASRNRNCTFNVDVWGSLISKASLKFCPIKEHKTFIVVVIVVISGKTDTGDDLLTCKRFPQLTEKRRSETYSEYHFLRFRVTLFPCVWAVWKFTVVSACSFYDGTRKYDPKTGTSISDATIRVMLARRIHSHWCFYFLCLRNRRLLKLLFMMWCAKRRYNYTFFHKKDELVSFSKSLMEVGEPFLTALNWSRAILSSNDAVFDVIVRLAHYHRSDF